VLSWLAKWLEQVIAVVLLAGFVDLLLPNKAMQRYVRLVAGLLILLTILSPVVRLLQGDYGTKLDDSIDGWFHDAPPASQVKMPTLQDIQRDGQTLRRQEQASAAALTERKLAEAMRVQIGKQTGLDVEAVTVQLNGSVGDAPDVQAVAVTLAAPQPDHASGGSSPEADGGSEASVPDGAAGQASGGRDGTNGKEDVEPVNPIAISVTAEPAAEGESGADGTTGGAYAEVGGSVANAVKQVLREGWSVDPGVVTVRQSGTNSGAGQ